MFTINDDNSIYATRGDIVFFSVSAEDDGVAYKFQAGDVVRIKVYGKKDAETVVLQKDFPVNEETETVEIFLTEEDTKIGNVISKPVDYWYEVELNPFDYPQTIIGYDEDGAKVFKLFPEGDDNEADIPTKEEIGFVDSHLDMTSPRPVQNQAVARAFEKLTEKANVVKVVQGKEAITFKIDANASIMYSTFEQSGIVSARNGLDAEPTITTIQGEAPALAYSASAGTVTLTFPAYRTITFVTKYAIVE